MIENAQITDVFVGFDGHNIFGFGVTLDFGGHVQGTGIYPINKINRDNLKALEGLLRVTCVNEVSRLKGIYVRVDRRFDDQNDKSIERIGHIVQNRWLTLSPVEDFGKIDLPMTGGD